MYFAVSRCSDCWMVEVLRSLMLGILFMFSVMMLLSFSACVNIAELLYRNTIRFRYTDKQMTIFRDINF